MIKFYWASLCSFFSIIRFKAIWKRNNKYNSTIPVNVFDKSLVSVGKYTYGELNIKSFGEKSSRLTIGNYCSIAEGTLFLLAGEHEYTSITTFPYQKYVLGETKVDTKTKGNIEIEDDVWIGERVIILSGVTIGQGAVIGAGSIVARDVPPYAIFAGNKIIKYRFVEQIIDQLIRFDFSNLMIQDFEEIKNIPSIEAFIDSDIYKRNSQ